MRLILLLLCLSFLKFIPPSSEMEKREYLYKILVIGDNAVGKSSIVKRYVHNFFTDRYKATVSFQTIVNSQMLISKQKCFHMIKVKDCGW